MSYDYTNSTGLISSDSSDLKSEVESEFVSALQAPSLSLAASSPQGVLIAAETLSRANIAKNNTEIANVVNPDYSYGVFLDSVAAFLGITRGSDKYTTGEGIILSGTGSTASATITIAAGSRVRTSNGDIFTVDDTVSLDSTGAGTCNITAQSVGPVPLPSGSLTIIDGTVGWSAASVSSSTVVTLGTAELTDAQFKTARKQRLFAQGLGSTGAIKSRLMAVDNVQSVNVIENVTGQTATAVNGVTFTMGAAVWICVAGKASDTDVAAAIWKARGGMPMDFGASGQGTQTSMATTDPYSGIAYTVKWLKAVDMVVHLRITAKQGSSTATSTAISDAALDYANGEISGEEGLVAGSDISAYEFSGAITAQFPGLFIVKAQVAVSASAATAPADSDYSDYIDMNPWERGVLSIGNITVTING